MHVKREMKEGHDIIDASLSCIGLSTEPLKVLFLDLLESAHQNIVSHTRIHWPASSKSGSFLAKSLRDWMKIESLY